jgi:Ca2+:H+ antiporter
MKEAPPKNTSHGGNRPPSRRSDSNSAPISSNNGKAAASSHSGPVGPDGLASAQPAPATDPDSSSRSRAVNTSPAAQPGAVVGDEGEKQDDTNKPKIPVAQRFWRTFKAVLLNSKINVLLVFVPVGIAVAQLHNVSPGLIFAMNAIAIVPLAGLLSYATESVAHRLGDSLGALLNVTFGNAVELIIL